MTTPQEVQERLDELHTLLVSDYQDIKDAGFADSTEVMEEIHDQRQRLFELKEQTYS